MEPFKDQTDMTIIIKVVYYTFTTMSTVGFGDMKPLNSAERILCAAAMISSVALCSLVISMFLEIFESLKKIDCEFGDLDELNMFINCICKEFNRSQYLPTHIEENIIDFFNYRWNHDKLQCVNDEDEFGVIKKLPD